MSQITITLDAAPSFAAQDYVLSESNQQAYNQLMAWPNWADYGTWLYGPAHAGKSHLAAIWAQRAGAKRIPPKALNDVEALLAKPNRNYLIDELSTLTEEMQTGLFHLLNHVKEQQAHILLVSQHSPNQLALTLPDLRSRLKALPTVGLDSPDDMLLHAVWFKLFADRQLQVSAAVIDYLMQRSERSFDAIHRIIKHIDEAALEQKRDITVPFVRSLLI